MSSSRRKLSRKRRGFEFEFERNPTDQGQTRTRLNLALGDVMQGHQEEKSSISGGKQDTVSGDRNGGGRFEAQTVKHWSY